MDARNVVAKLAEITGFLKPTAEATAADLRTARVALATALLHGQAENTHVISPHSVAPELNPALQAELESVKSEAELHAKSNQRRPLTTRAFRRELPVLTSIDPASIPAWAAGSNPELTLGPFQSAGGWPVWFDFYGIAQGVSVVRGPGGAVLMVLPIQNVHRPSATFPLGPGSAWISSQAIAASAPSGSYSGLLIRGGTLNFSTPVALFAGALQVPANVVISVTLQPDPGATAPGTGSGPGADAAHSSADVAAEVTFVLAPGAPATVTSADASMTLYGVTVPLRRATLSPAYDAVLNLILIPYTTSLASFTVVRSLSDVFTLSGSAPIAAVGWALTVAVIDPGSLGTAAGAGLFALQTSAGLQASWRGLAAGTVAVGPAYLAVGQGLLGVLAFAAHGRRVTQTMKLWVEENAPRRATIDMRYAQPFRLSFYSSQQGVQGEEVLQVLGKAEAHLDRPKTADGMRLGLALPQARFSIFENSAGVAVRLAGSFPLPNVAQNQPETPIAFALTNALLKTTPPRTISLFGTLASGTSLELVSGRLTVRFELYFALPALPDPYAANFDIPLEQRTPPALGLECLVQWNAPETPALSFSFQPLSVNQSVGTALSSNMSSRIRAVAARTAADVRVAPQPLLSVSSLSASNPLQTFKEDASRTGALRAMFNAAVNSTEGTLSLLDVSSNADQFGVSVSFRGRTGNFPIEIENLDLAVSNNNVRVFTLPQVQWEPVYTIQNPAVGTFPSPLTSADDGGPTLLGVDTVDLVPLAPRPVLENIVTAFNSVNRPTVGALFTLPFGIQAMANLVLPQGRGDPGAFLDFNRPSFPSPSQPLDGGLQVAVTAYEEDEFPTGATPSLAGAAVQLRNGLDASGNALFKSVLGDQVDTIFNAEFAPDGKNPRVPVTRIDFSGYGASLFSHWLNPLAQTAQTSQVRFDVMVGRTAYEVVQVRSVLYPWGVRVVRTITIQRTGGGGVYRRDSGWIAASDGVFDFPSKGSAFKIVTHPGVVRGVFGVRNIRDTSQVYERTYLDAGIPVTVKLAAVRFDANARISGVVRGGSNGDVVSVNQIGFVQLEPSGDALTPAQYADLLADQGALGGPVDCVVDVGASGQQMRVTRVDVDSARSAGGRFEFSVAARGSPVLPKDGQWSVIRKSVDPSQEGQALDKNFGIPLVREGPADLAEASNSNPYQFADPANVLNPGLTQSDYGWMWSTGAQRILFARPRIAKGAKSITSDLAPLLADSFAMGNTAGIFPASRSCLNVPSFTYQLQILGGGGLRLVLPFATFAAALVGGGTTRELGNSDTTRYFADYTKTVLTVSLDSTSTPSWTYAQDGIALVHESNGTNLKTTRGRIQASSVSASKFTLQNEEFGAVLNPAKGIMPLFTSGTLGGNIPPAGATAPFDSTPAADPAVDVKAGLKIELPIPKGLDMFIGVTADKGYIELETDFHSFFALDIVVPILVGLILPGAVKFTVDAETIKAAKALPGASSPPVLGGKEALLLAVGLYAAGEDPSLPPLQFNYKVFVGAGFTYNNKPGQTAVGIAFVYDAQGSVQYPIGIALVEAAIKLQGQVGIEIRTGGHVFGVLKGKLAFELTIALFIDIEFDLPDFTLAEIKFGK